MAQTSNSYTVGSSGQAGPYSYSFPTIADTDVKVSVNGTVKTVTTHYTLDTGNTRITFVSGQEPSTGDRVIVYRDTAEDPINSTFVSGSTIRSNELNDNFKQLLYIAQESDNQGLNTLGGTMQGTLEIGEDQVIKFEGATANANETTLTVVDPTADRTITLPNITGTVVTTGDTGTVTSAMITDGTIANADISTSAEIAVSKLADGLPRQILQTNSTGTEVEWTSNLYPPGSLDVTSNSSLHGTLTVDGTSTLTGNTTVGGTLGVTGQITGNVTGNVTGNADTATDLAAATKITASEQAAHTVNDTTYFTTSAAEARYFNATTSETIKDGDAFPDNDTTIATTAAINDRIIDLVDDVGGFVPIANENSFPNANPDVNNGPGTLVSIKSIGSTRTPSGGTVTISSGNVDNNATVTITGCGSTTLTSGFGVIVETTSTLHTYAFHRLVPKATEVTTVAGSITNINSVAANDTNINAVASNASNINAAVANATNINTVATNNANITTTATNIAKITTVADDLNEGTSEIDTVATNITNVNNVGNNIANVNTVATNNANITTVADDLNESTSEIDTVATNITNVNNVGNNISSINNCNTNLTAIEHYGDTYQIGTGAPTQRADGSSLVIGDLWFDSSSNKTMMVRDGSAGDGYAAVSPSQSVLDDISIVSGNITWQEDLGSIGDALSTGTGNSIETAADNIANIQRLGTADAVADMAILATTDIVADMNTLATTDIVADMDALGPKAAEIGRLGTTAAIADMAILGTTDCVADMAILGTADVVSDLNTLATADVVADMNTLAVSDVISDMNTLATSGNVTAMDNCSGSISNINTTAGSISNVNTTAGSISNVNTVAGSIADVNRYANEYKISASAPSSPSEGDLWYDDTNNLLKYRDASSWQSISAGIASLLQDTTPELGGHLDCNDKNLTEVATVSGNNLQLDFGTL